MNKIRLTAVGVLMTLAAAISGVGASAADPGVGTTEVATTVANVKLGDLLELGLLSDAARATNDGTAAASTKLTAAKVVSSVLGVNEELAYEASSDGNNSVDIPASPLPGEVAINTAVASATVTAGKLSASVDATGAHAGLSAGVSNVSLAGGLVTAEGLSSALTADSVGTASDGVRQIHVGAIEVVNLAEFLAGLGIDLSALPIETLSALLVELGATVNGVTGTLNAHIDELEAAADLITDALTGLIAGAQLHEGTVHVDNPGGLLPGDGTVVIDPNDPLADDTVTEVLDSETVQAIEGALAGLGLTVDLSTMSIDQLQGLLSQITDLSVDALLGALDVLAGMPLLGFDGLDLTVATKAVSSLEESLHVISATIGDVRVGGNVIPGVDLLGTAGAIVGLVTDIEAQIGSVLGTISPQLANLVDVNFLVKDEGKKAIDNMNVAWANLTAMQASINPPSLADLDALISGLVAQIGADDLLASAGVEVPTLAGLMTTLEGVLNIDVTSTLGALTGGATINLVTLASNSAFTPASAGVGGPETPRGATPVELPRTGSGSLQLAALAMFMIALGLGLPKWQEEYATARR